MNRKQAKELLPVIIAFAEGKTIQYSAKGYNEWLNADIPTDGLSFNPYKSDYRIKPEPKLIPFDFSDADKLIGKPVKHKSTKFNYMISAVCKDYIYIEPNEYTFYLLLEFFEFLDGSPCGKIEE